MVLDRTEASPQIAEAYKLLAYCRARGIAAETPYVKDELHLGP
jgi:hypothetical protein